MQAAPVAAGIALELCQLTAPTPRVGDCVTGVELASSSVTSSAPLGARAAFSKLPPILSTAPFSSNREDLLAAIEAPAASAFTSPAVATPTPVLMMPSFAPRIEHSLYPLPGGLSSIQRDVSKRCLPNGITRGIKITRARGRQTLRYGFSIGSIIEE